MRTCLVSIIYTFLAFVAIAFVGAALDLPIWAAWIIIIIALFFLLLNHFGRAEKAKDAKARRDCPPIPAIKILDRPGDSEEDEWHTYIAGINYRAVNSDLGGFVGYVTPDPGNRHSPIAMAVITASGKLLGYIPAKEVGDFREWCSVRPVPCVGFICRKDGQFAGRVKALLPCSREFMQKEFTRYFEWVNAHYGAPYLPDLDNVIFNIEAPAAAAK